MRNSYNGYRDRDNLIVDVHPPKASEGFDVRQPSVRHRPIGQLEEEYLKRQVARNSRLQYAFNGPTASPSYTRIPPLKTLEFALRRSGLSRVRQLRKSLVTIAATTASFISLALATILSGRRSLA